MNLIQRLKIWNELKRLEARVHESPSPSTYVDLGQVYINLGMHDRALQLADDGLALFPQSSELRKLKRFAQKRQLNERIAELRGKLGAANAPEAHLELAALHLELGDLEAVQQVCEDAIRRFPNDPGAHLVLARACLLDFYRDLGAREGIAAVEHLRSVIRCGGEVGAARRLLAELGWRIGAVAEVREQIRALRELGVEDPDLRALEHEVQHADAEPDEDVHRLLHEVEARGRLARLPLRRDRRVAPQGATAPSSDAVRDGLARIAQAPGVVKATYIRGAKALVKGDIQDGRDSFLRLVRVVARAAQRAARRMDIGNFSKGAVDGDFGRICICSYGEALAAVQCDFDVDPDAVLAELQELVAGSLVGSRGNS